MRALAIALLATACMPSFDSVSDIRDLRVLAVQAEPPEAQFDQNGAQDVTVRALVVDPFPRSAAQVNGRLCASTDSRRCETGPRQELPSLVGPAGGEFSWVVRVPRAVLDFALGNDTLRGLGGIRVMLSLDVNDGDPHGVLFASKDLLYSPAGGTPNHNPLMTGLHLTRDTSDRRCRSASARPSGCGRFWRRTRSRSTTPPICAATRCTCASSSPTRSSPSRGRSSIATAPTSRSAASRPPRA